MYMEKCKSSPSGVGHGRSKCSLASLRTTEGPLSSAGGDWKCAEDFDQSRYVGVH